jgi:hypothetical protein
MLHTNTLAISAEEDNNSFRELDISPMLINDLDLVNFGTLPSLLLLLRYGLRSYLSFLDDFAENPNAPDNEVWQITKREMYLNDAGLLLYMRNVNIKEYIQERLN